MEDYRDYGACDQYSARLSDVNNMGDLLGSGVLLIRHKEQRAILLTCVHVVEKILDHDSFQAVFSADPNREAVIFKKNNYLHKAEKPSQDYILYETVWQSWMDKLADTRLEPPQATMNLVGFGCPDKYNGCPIPSNPFEGGDILKCYISNATPNSEKSYFYCRLKDTSSGMTDLNLQGFSGTGLFNRNQCLVGIVKGKNMKRINPSAVDVPEYDPEFIALNVSKFLSAFPSQNDQLLESTAMVHCLSSPFFPRELYTDAKNSDAGLLNLWIVLLTIRSPLVLFLFSGTDDLKNALKETRLLFPRWEIFSMEDFKRNVPLASSTYSALCEEGLAYIRQKLISWKHTYDKRPILIHINITSAPLSPSELLKCVKKMGGCLYTDYVFLSDDYCKAFLCSTTEHSFVSSMSHREMIDWLWEHCDSTKIPLEEFDDKTYDIYECVENLHHWLKCKNWEALSNFLMNQDTSVFYLRKVIAWLNDGKKDAYHSLMISFSKQNTNSVCRWLLLLCCRWSLPLLRDMPEDSIDFQLLASLWEKPRKTQDATLSQIAATVQRLALIQEY